MQRVVTVDGVADLAVISCPCGEHVLAKLGHAPRVAIQPRKTGDAQNSAKFKFDRGARVRPCHTGVSRYLP